MKTRVQELNNFSRFARFLPFSEASLKNGQAVAAIAAHRPGHLFLTWVCHYPPYTQAKLRFSCCPGSRHSHLLIACVCVLVAQSCLTLCDPMNCSLPGFPVRGILQARILEWTAIPFSRGSSPPRDQTLVSSLQADSLPFELQGSPTCF